MTDGMIISIEDYARLVAEQERSSRIEKAVKSFLASATDEELQVRLIALASSIRDMPFDVSDKYLLGLLSQAEDMPQGADNLEGDKN